MSLLSEPVWTKRVAYCFAQLLTGMNDDTNYRRRLRTFLYSVFGQYGDQAFFPAVDDWPAVVVGQIGQEMYVLIDGCRKKSQFVACAEGYKSVLVGPSGETRNPFFEDVQDRVQRYINTQGMANKTSVTVAGYSLGGAVAHLMFRDSYFEGIPYPGRQAISFGAPRAAQSQDNAMMLVNARHARWIRPQDVIPMMPPSCVVCLALRIAAGSRSCAKFNRFQHVVDGDQINDDGSVTVTYFPTNAPVDSCASLAGFMEGAFFGRPSAHDLSNYVSALAVDISGTGGGSDEPMAPQVPEVRPVNTPAQLVAAERVAERAIARLELQQDAVPVSIPTDRSVYAKRTGKVWTVYFGGEVIAVRPGKKAARHLANDLQGFLSRLQKAAVVSPQALVDTLQGYLQAASDPAGGFTPVMNTRVNP